MEIILSIIAFISGIIVGGLVCSNYCHVMATDFVSVKQKYWYTEGYTVALLDTTLKPKKQEKKRHENISTERDGNIITIHRHSYSAGN
jgi:hypothetical protein